MSRALVALTLVLVMQACATYYQSNLAFNQQFESGQLEQALSTLKADPREARGRQAFLYFVNKGLVLSMMGRYEESNDFFERAYLFGEDYRKNITLEAASFLTNPAITPYKGEDHEHLLLLYYKALNFIKLNKTEEALVECRRLNIRLQQLADRYRSETKFQRDAFIHTLMGLIYETDKDYNNAFIAYRNAYDIYQTDYRQLFDLSAPVQLKKDLLRTAHLSGLTEELDYFKTEFDMVDYVYRPSEGGELVMLWHNGLSPVKAEWGVNFMIDRRGDMVYFNSQGMNVSFPFSLRDYDENDRSSLSSLEVLRVAFPRYIERPEYYQQAEVTGHGQQWGFELLQDVNKIAFKSLQQRMDMEFSKALIRVAFKKVTEHQLKKENRALGSVLGIIHAATEKADTRNWQTLPHSIHYVRVPLQVGQNELTLRLMEPNGKTDDHVFTYHVKPGQLLFHTFTSLESSYPRY
ncbi:MAG: hypothetical protein MUC38_10740 [Cyclobacteriaceae bacterium]|jgi:hypothetical protein|nr:hypothetical protein [Cyclobacteriaceae bacterium]